MSNEIKKTENLDGPRLAEKIIEAVYRTSNNEKPLSYAAGELLDKALFIFVEQVEKILDFDNRIKRIAENVHAKSGEKRETD